MPRSNVARNQAKLFASYIGIDGKILTNEEHEFLVICFSVAYHAGRTDAFRESALSVGPRPRRNVSK